MRKAYTAQTIRELEAPYLAAPDYDGNLMAQAAYRLFQQVQSMLPEDDRGPVLLLVGPGNNGADTLFAGAHLARGGVTVEALLLSSRVHGPAYEAFTDAGGHTMSTLPSPLTHRLIIDGIVGTGAQGPLRGAAQETVATLCSLKERAAGRFPAVLACDIPSGIDGSTAEVFNPVLPADVTVTFIAEKVPHLSVAEHLCGTVITAPLGIEQDLDSYRPTIIRPTDSELAGFLPRPGFRDHKYTRGVLGVITGSSDYPGAALLSTAAAVNSGCGMVRFIGPQPLADMVQMSSPEAVCSPHPHTIRVQAWAAGSGATGQDRESDLIHAITAEEAAVIDAAALPLAAGLVAEGRTLGAHKILTPHAGELAQFFTTIAEFNPTLWRTSSGTSSSPHRSDIEKNPLTWVQVAHAITGATVLLKGATTLICSGEYLLSTRAETSWLATAGSGDTLTGILGSLLAQVIGARSESPGAEVFAYTAACATRIHQLAALAVNDGVPGPVPPSLVTAQLPAVIAGFLS